MTQLAYKKKDLYDDVRSCIREGLSIRETAELCGCKYETVRMWTEDIRDVKKRGKRTKPSKEPFDKEFMLKVRSEYINGTSRKELRAKYNLTDKQAWNITRDCVQKKEEQEMRGGFISSRIDMRELNAQAKNKEVEAEEKVAEIVEVPVVEKPVEEAVATVIELPKSVPNFRNLALSMDGKDFRYSIRGDGMLLCYDRMTNQQFTVRTDCIETFTVEVMDILKRFGSMMG